MPRAKTPGAAFGIESKLDLRYNGQLTECWQRHKLPSVKVQWIPRYTQLEERRLDDLGWVEFNTRTVFSPRVTDVFTLYCYLRQMARFILHQDKSQDPRHMQLLAAEHYAIHTINAEGLRMSQDALKMSHDLVRTAIEEDRAVGIYITVRADRSDRLPRPEGWVRTRRGRNSKIKARELI
jgi:hypothetical protein